MKSRIRLYVDESGDHSPASSTTSWDKRYLCLLGCAYELDDYAKNFCPAITALKERHFRTDDPDSIVILHREEIKARKYPFHVLRDPAAEESFNADLLEIFKKSNFRVFCVVVDKCTTVSKHYGPLPYHPYHVGMLALMERYCGWLSFIKAEGDVLAESRGAREDYQLKSAYRTVHESGTRYRGKEFFQSVLTSKEIKLKKKEHNIAGLQLSDLIAYPSKKAILHALQRVAALSGFTKAVEDSIQWKYNCHAYDGRITGYGKVFLG